MKALLILCVFCLGCLKALQHPQFGAYLMAWVGYMNPHRLVPWSFVGSLPLAAGAFAVTVISYVMMKDKPKNWFSFPLLVIIFMLLWSVVCTFNGFFPDYAQQELTRFFKIQLGIFLTVMILRQKQHIILLVWTIFISIGYYGVKGGVFTIATGGSFRVWGPTGSFIQGNNELALALLMVVPLVYFLQQQYEKKWVKHALTFSMLMMVAAAIGSHSRGALLALIASGLFLWWKSRSKAMIGMAFVIGIFVALPFMPSHWFERMETIQTYQEDASAMGRINAWTVAVNVANDRITGGGFGHWGTHTFAIYAPIPEDVHDAHSIYFEVLGELGYPGLIMFLTILGSIWFGSKKNATRAETLQKDKELEWIAQLSRMLQVSLVAYMTGGAFLGLAYWDLPYHILALVLCCRNLLNDVEKENESLKTNGRPLRV